MNSLNKSSFIESINGSATLTAFLKIFILNFLFYFNSFISRLFNILKEGSNISISYSFYSILDDFL